MKTLLLAFGILGGVTAPLCAVAAPSVSQENSAALHSHPNLDNGAQLFQTCAACHGASGGGTVDGQIPRIAGQHFSVLVKQIVDYRGDRRWDPRMEHFADQHHLTSAQDIADVAGFVSQLQVRPETPVGVGSGELLSRGAEVYSSSCASCHGKSGDGSERDQIPRVAGQNYEYLRRQIYDAVDGRRPNFPATHIRLLKKLEFDDITGVADYMSRMPRKVDPLQEQDVAAN
jgi:cytochrome c553